MNADEGLKSHDGLTESGGQGGWLAVGSIASGTFLLVTTEFLPIGLLSRIAADLGVSEGTAGLSVTAPGFVAAAAAPALTLLAGAIDRRIVIVGLTASVVASGVITAIAPSFPVLLLGRVILGLAVGGTWSFAVAAGRRLVAEDAGSRATSIISAGIGAGTVCGLPAGALIGEWGGWRFAFGANAALGALIVLAQVRFLPRMAAETAVDVRRLVAFSRVPMARIGLIASGLVAGGQFVAYTFLEPFLRHEAGFDPDWVALPLAAYAAASVAGAFLGERLAGFGIRRAFPVVAAWLGVAILATSLSSGRPAAALLLATAWGVAFGAFTVCVQIWMFTSSPTLYEAGSALMVSAFQVALAAGAALGGAIVDSSGERAAFLLSGLLAFAGAGVSLLVLRVSADSLVQSMSGSDLDLTGSECPIVTEGA